MDILLFIVLGALAGWIAGMIMKSDNSLVVDIILGIIGSFVGGFIFKQFGQPGVTGLNVYSLIVAIIGAIILIFLGRVLRK